MSIHMTLNQGRVPVKVWTRDIEPEAIQQLVNASQLPIGTQMHAKPTDGTKDRHSQVKAGIHAAI